MGDLAAAASTFERSLSHAENCDDAAATVAIGKALAEIRGKLEAKAATPALAAPVTPAAEVTPTTTEEEETTTAGGEEEEGGGTAEEEEESPLQPGKDPKDPHWHGRTSWDIEDICPWCPTKKMAAVSRIHPRMQCLE